LTAFVHRNTIVMARTDEWKALFPRLGFKPGNIRVVPACIGEDWIAEGGRTTISSARLVWLGKFRRYKCPDHAIRAMAQVVRVVPGARLILAGRHDDRAYEEELRNLVGELGLKGVAEFRFDISEEEKRSLLDSCCALVLPSTVEGFGIVVLEANARGAPVIASSGVPESAVRAGENGLRYPFGQITELSSGIIRVLTDGELYPQLSANSVAFAGRFAWRRVCSQYEEVLKECVRLRSKHDAAYRKATL